MNIVIFNGNLEPSTFIRELAFCLKNKNHHIFIAGFDNSILNYTSNGIHYISIGSNRIKWRFIARTIILCIQNIRNSQTILKRVLYSNKKRPSIKQLLSQINIINVLDVIQPDIIHIQWASHIYLFKFLLDNPIEPRPRVIVSLRGRLVNVSPFVDAEIHKMYSAYFPKIAGIHAVSRAISLKAKAWGVESYKIAVIYSGVNLHKILLYKINWNIHSIVNILSVGRFHWIKGYTQAIDSIKKLSSLGYKIQYTIIAGQAPEEILFQIQDLNLSEYIQIIPNLPQELIFESMQKSDIFLLPSVEEGIANVVLEAMAVGLPVVSSDCGGMAEAIENGVNGLLFQNRNVAHMAAQLEKMINYSPEDRERMAMLARQRVTEQFGSDRLGKEMAAFYEEVCKKN